MCPDGELERGGKGWHRLQGRSNELGLWRMNTIPMEEKRVAGHSKLRAQPEFELDCPWGYGEGVRGWGLGRERECGGR